MIRGFAKQFAEKQLGPRETWGKEKSERDPLGGEPNPFAVSEAEQDEPWVRESQLKLILQMQDNVARVRDIQLSLKELKKSKEERTLSRPKMALRRFGGRIQRVAHPENSLNDTSIDFAIQKAEMKLQQLEEERTTLASIPGFGEAYEGSIVELYQMRKGVKIVNELSMQREELLAQADWVRQQSADSAAGSVRGIEAVRVKELEEQALLLDARIDFVTGRLTYKRAVELKQDLRNRMADHLKGYQGLDHDALSARLDEMEAESERLNEMKDRLFERAANASSTEEEQLMSKASDLEEQEKIIRDAIQYGDQRLSDPNRPIDVEKELVIMNSEDTQEQLSEVDRVAIERANQIQFVIDTALDVREQYGESMESDETDPWYIANRISELKPMIEAFNKGRMVEIPSAKRLVDQGLSNLRAHRPFMIAGHLGSGKTELARHMARLFMIENGVGFDAAEADDLDAIYDRLEPEVFSGSDESSVYDLLGKLKLKRSESEDPILVAQRVEQVREAMEQAGYEDVPKEDIMKVLLGKSDVMETVFSYGPLGRAIRDGKPIIIDEINMMPPEVSGRINDLLTRRPGDEVRLQENGEEAFVVGEGFGVIATMNLGAQYHGIKEVNAAFKSRWVAVEHNYPEASETFDLALSALLRKDRVRFPAEFVPRKTARIELKRFTDEHGVERERKEVVEYEIDPYEQLIDLSLATAEIQELFTGKTEGQLFMAMTGGATARKSQLEKAVISPRDLMRKIIEPWKQEGFKDLDGIVARNILASEVFSEDDQKLMTEVFLRRGFFQGWSEADFHAHNIDNVSQAELDVLQVAMGGDDYKAFDKKFSDMRSEASGRANMIADTLRIGTGE